MSVNYALLNFVRMHYQITAALYSRPTVLPFHYKSKMELNNNAEKEEDRERTK